MPQMWRHTHKHTLIRAHDKAPRSPQTANIQDSVVERVSSHDENPPSWGRRCCTVYLPAAVQRSGPAPPVCRPNKELLCVACSLTVPNPHLTVCRSASGEQDPPDALPPCKLISYRPTVVVIVLICRIPCTGNWCECLWEHRSSQCAHMVITVQWGSCDVMWIYKPRLPSPVCKRGPQWEGLKTEQGLLRAFWKMLSCKVRGRKAEGIRPARERWQTCSFRKAEWEVEGRVEEAQRGCEGWRIWHGGGQTGKRSAKKSKWVDKEWQSHK